MDSPLINPWLIYLIGISQNLSCGLVILAVVSGLLSVIGTIGFLANLTSPFSEDKLKYPPVFKKMAFIAIPFFVFFVLFSCLIPDQKWLVGLAVNSQVTPKNIETATGAIVKTKDSLKQDVLDIIEKINSSNGKLTVDDKKDESKK